MPSAAVSIRNTTTLDDIARTIRSEWERGRVAVTDALEARLNVGCALRDARARFPGDREFGEWFREQGFPFARKAAWEMRRFAEHEPKIRAVIMEMRAGGEGVSFSALMRELYPPDAKQLQAPLEVADDDGEELTEDELFAVCMLVMQDTFNTTTRAEELHDLMDVYEARGDEAAVARVRAEATSLFGPSRERLRGAIRVENRFEAITPERRAEIRFFLGDRERGLLSRRPEWPANLDDHWALRMVLWITTDHAAWSVFTLAKLAEIGEWVGSPME